MGAQCSIGYINNRGEYTTIICSHDGYLEYVGRVLLENYTTQELVDELISFGDLFEIGEVIHPKYRKDDESVCYYKYPDDSFICNESDVISWQKYSPVISDKVIQNEEYNYLFKNNKWYWCEYDDKEWKVLNKRCIDKQYNPPIFDIKAFRKYVMTKENKKVVKEETMVNSINSEISVQIKPESWILMEKRNNKALLFDKENHKYIICYSYRELDNAMIRYNSYILFDEITESINELYSIGKDEMPNTIKKRLREICDLHRNIDETTKELKRFLGVYGIEYDELLIRSRELNRILLGGSYAIEDDIDKIEVSYLQYEREVYKRC